MSIRVIIAFLISPLFPTIVGIISVFFHVNGSVEKIRIGEVVWVLIANVIIGYPMAAVTLIPFYGVTKGTALSGPVSYIIFGACVGVVLSVLTLQPGVRFEITEGKLFIVVILSLSSLLFWSIARPDLHH